MKTNQLLRNVAIPAASGTLLFMGACGEDDEKESAAYLVGEWEIKSVTSEFSSGSSSFSSTKIFGVEDEDGYIYEMSFEFQVDGDFVQCYSYEDTNDASNNYSDCYDGEWEWVSAGKQLKITHTYEYDGVTATYNQNINVIKLTKTEFVGGWTYEYDDYNGSFEFTAVKK